MEQYVFPKPARYVEPWDITFPEPPTNKPQTSNQENKQWESVKKSFDGEMTFAEDGHSATFIISTETPDRIGDIVISRGCNLDDCQRYCPIFFNHDEKSFPIGSAKKTPDSPPDIQIFDDHIIGTCYFNEDTEEARTTYKMLKDGHMKGCSIGLQIDPSTVEYITGREAMEKYNKPKVRIINNWKLAEFSVCGLPMNPEALVVEVN